MNKKKQTIHGDNFQHKENKQHKDSVFVDLFFTDETAKKNLLSLYNALHDTDFQDENLIHRMKIEDVLYKNFKNDISFEINGEIFVFGEHQASINPNMPLRCLMYTGRVYENIVSTEARYKEKLAMIPTPEFYTFYNGKADAPIEQDLYLSSAFKVPSQEHALELKVKVININTNKGHRILEKCQVLKEYSLFIDTVRKFQIIGDNDSIKKAIQECINNDILTDYLSRKGKEVTNMLIAEYDYETDIRVKQDEAREDGWREGLKDGLLLSAKIYEIIKKNDSLTNEQIARQANCLVKDVENVRAMFGI